jgi:hypothetical protein
MATEMESNALVYNSHPINGDINAGTWLSRLGKSGI